MKFNIYDVILENNQRSASAIISDTESGNADTISITEMLQKVKTKNIRKWFRILQNLQLEKKAR